MFAPVARIETIWILLALTSKNGWKIHHLDVKSAFVNGELDEEFFFSQPKGFVNNQHPQKVYKLLKATYGLRQAQKHGILESKNT